MAEISLANALQIFAWPRNLKQISAPTKNQTYARRSPETGKREMIGYGGSNPSMNIDPRYIIYVERPDSLFKKQCVYVRSVCWMDPWARIENIPAHVTEVDVYFYHAYL